MMNPAAPAHHTALHPPVALPPLLVQRALAPMCRSCGPSCRPVHQEQMRVSYQIQVRSNHHQADRHPLAIVAAPRAQAHGQNQSSLQGELLAPVLAPCCQAPD